MKTIVVAAVAGVVLAACSGGDDAVSPTTAPVTTPATVPDSVPATVPAVSGLARGAWSVGAALAEIPAGGEARFELTTGDIGRIAGLFGLTPPADLADTDAVLGDWLLPLTFPGRPDYRPLPVWVALQEPLLPAVPAELAAFDELLGWSLRDVDAFVDYRPPAPGYLVVASGEFADDALAGLDEAVPGVVSSHAGDDLATDFDNRDPLDRLGRAVRLARRDDVIAMSLTTPLAEHWLAGDGPTLADDSRLAAVAGALDSAGVLTAHLYRDQFTFDPVSFAPRSREAIEEMIARMPEVVPFDTVGIGWSIADDGTPRTVLVYAPLFAPDDLAAQLADVFADGVSLATGLPLTETLGAVDPDIAVVDGVVRVTYDPGERFWWSAVQAVYQRDLPFLSS